MAGSAENPALLDKARAGLYPESIEAEVSPERLRRFFIKEDHHYRIQKNVRDLCVFARQNVTVDPPFSRVDPAGPVGEHRLLSAGAVRVERLAVVVR